MVFLKKEFKEYYRSGKLFILGILSFLMALMNVAVAKLTPWLFDMLADKMQESGMSIEVKTIDASACWQQYYKNLPMFLIVILVVFAGSFAKEYTKGTLLLVVTKGYPRKKIFVSKTMMMTGLYSLAYLICFGLTYFYADFYWDNSVLENIILAALLYYVFGLLLISAIIFFSAVFTDATGIIGATAGYVMLMYFLAVIPKVKKYLPIKLCESENLLYGKASISDFTAPLVISLAIIIALFVSGAVIFDKKKL